MPRCLTCMKDIDQPSEKVLQKALEARTAGQEVHWDCPKCGSLDSVIGVEEIAVPRRPNVVLYDSAYKIMKRRDK